MAFNIFSGFEPVTKAIKPTATTVRTINNNDIPMCKLSTPFQKYNALLSGAIAEITKPVTLKQRMPSVTASV